MNQDARQRAVRMMIGSIVIAIGLLTMVFLAAPAQAIAAPDAQTGIADLRVTSLVSPQPEVLAGEQFTYTLLIDNLGPDQAENVVITDTLISSGFVDPNGCSIVVRTDSGAIDEYVCNLAASTGVFDLGTFGSNHLNPRSPSDMGRIIITINATGSKAATLENVTTVTSDTPDPDLSNNIAVTSLSITAAADLRVVSLVSPSPEVQAGDQFTYTLLIDNLGPTIAENIVVTDTLFSSGFVQANGCSIAVKTDGGAIDEFNCNFALSTGVFDLGTFGANYLNPRSPSDMGRIIITINATASGPITLENVTTVTSDTFDPDQTNNISITSLEVTSVADLELSTTCDSATVLAGETISCGASITNNGPSTAEGSIIEMAIPSAFEIVSVSSTNGGCSAGIPGSSSSPTTCAVGLLGVGASQTMTVELRARADAVTNGSSDEQIAQVDAMGYSSTVDPLFANNLSNAVITIEAQADLDLDTFVVGTPYAGSLIHYEYQVSNLGPSVSRNVSLRDFLPEQVEFVSAFVGANSGPDAVPIECDVAEGSNALFCPIGDIEPSGGVSTILLVNVRINSDVPEATNVSNDADVYLTDTPDPDPTNNTEQSSFSVLISADLSIEKDSDPEKVNAGEQKKYAISVTNHGPSDARQVVVYDVLPDEVIYELDTNANSCTQPANFAGLRAILSGDNEVPPAVTNAKGLSSFVFNTDTNELFYTIQVSNIGEIVGAHIHQGAAGVNGPVEVTLFSGPGSFDSTNPLVGSVPVAPALAADILANPDQYYVNVHTTAIPSGEIRGQLALTQNAPVKCDIGALKPDQSRQFDLFVKVRPETALDSTITNVAGVINASLSGDPLAGNNVATSTNLVQALADLRVLKFASPSPSLTVGEKFTYTIAVDNLGPSAAPNVTISDTLISSGLVEVSGCSIEIQTAGGASTISECNVGMSTGVFDLATMGITALNPRSPVDPGRALITINGTANEPTVLENLTTVTSDAVDPQNANNYATITLSIETPVADLSVHVLGMPDGPVGTGEELQLFVVVDNLGPHKAHDVEVVQELIGNAPFDISAINPDALGNQPTATCVPNTPLTGVVKQTVTCTLGDPMDMLISPAATQLTAADLSAANVKAAATGTSRWVIELILQSDSSFAFTGLVSASADETDPHGSNNIAALQSSVACDTTGETDLSLTKTAPGSNGLAPGSSIVYALAYKNHSTNAAYCVNVVEEVPAYTRFDASTSDSGWSCIDGAPEGTVCLYDLGTLASGAQGELAFGVSVLSSLTTSETITNTATIRSSTLELSPLNNVGDVSVKVLSPTGEDPDDAPEPALFLPSIAK